MIRSHMGRKPEQLDRIRANILPFITRKYRAAGFFPSQRELQAAFGASATSVSKVLAELEQAGEIKINPANRRIIGLRTIDAANSQLALIAQAALVGDCLTAQEIARQWQRGMEMPEETK